MPCTALYTLLLLSQSLQAMKLIPEEIFTSLKSFFYLLLQL
jgi:hypothetical protein